MKTIKLAPFPLAFLFSFSFICSITLTAQSPIFYGMTAEGGNVSNPGDGVIFTVNPGTNVETVVWDFGNGTDGQQPYGDLVYNTSNHLFYGMTNVGGSNSDGVIFAFNPSINAENVVWNFGSGTDGKFPVGDLVYDAGNGLFYGMTTNGGSNNDGVIFTFNPSTNAENVVWNFGSGTDGQSPTRMLIYNASNQLFYGMTYSGGTNISFGTIFTFDPSTNAENVVWNFGHGTDGQNPIADLVYDASNQLYYGVTEHGGGINNTGVILTFNPSTNTENVVWTFGNGSDGQVPVGDLVYNATNGLFYGMTQEGGTHGSPSGDGVIFTFNPTSNAESVVWDFGSGSDGQSPYGNLVYYASNGLFYGMTTNGGSSSDGVIFTFNPSTNAENVVWNFVGNPTNGAYPLGSLVLYNGPAGISEINNYSSVNIYPVPCTGPFTISGLQQGQVVEVYDYTGKELYDVPVDKSTLHFDISSLSNGIYLVRILNMDGTLAAQEKEVKMN